MSDSVGMTNVGRELLLVLAEEMARARKHPMFADLMRAVAGTEGDLVERIEGLVGMIRSGEGF